MQLPTTVLLRDVTLRDGLQDEAPVPTEVKVALFEALVAAGVRDLELTSFVRPDRVPAMADAEQLCAATEHPDVTRWGLVLNVRGAERALAAGLRHLQYVVSISDTHSRHNAGMDRDASLAQFETVAAGARDGGAALEVTLATSFGCPFEHHVAPATVADAARRAVDAGATSIGLADTIGVAVPSEVDALVGLVAGAVDVPVGAHIHNTHRLAVANALAAIGAGATRVDGSVGGLGGCPFAPGASGNMALEDLAFGLGAMGVETGIDLDALVDAAALACHAVGREVGSHVGVAGDRFVTAG